MTRGVRPIGHALGDLAVSAAPHACAGRLAPRLSFCDDPFKLLCLGRSVGGGWCDGWWVVGGGCVARMDGWTGGRVDGWTGGRVDGPWTGGRVDGWTGGRVDGWTGGRVDGWTGGRVDGRTGGRADGRTGGFGVGPGRGEWLWMVGGGGLQMREAIGTRRLGCAVVGLGPWTCALQPLPRRSRRACAYRLRDMP